MRPTRRWFAILDQPTMLVIFGLVFADFAIMWTLISDGFSRLFEEFDELRYGPARPERQSLPYLFYLYFGYPWLALSSGAIAGLVTGVWIRRRTLSDLDNRVKIVYSRACGLPSPKWWSLLSSRRSEVVVICAAFAMPLLFSMSLKCYAYAMVAAHFLVTFTSERSVFREAMSKVDADASTSQQPRARRWRRRWRLFNAGLVAIAIPALGYFSWDVYTNFVIDIRESALEHEQFRSGLDPRGDP